MKYSLPKKNKKNPKESQAKRKISFLLILLLILFLFLALMSILNVAIKKNTIGIRVINSPLAFSATEYPILKNIYEPQISAKSAIIIEDDSKKIIYSKNSKLRLPPASTTKIMTALTSLDYFKPEDILTVKQITNEGSVIGLVEGDRMSFENLFYAMLLPSANDAAHTIAQNYPGGVGEFTNAMNKNTREFSMIDTHFEDPTGLIDNKDFTTVYDLALLSSIAFNNEYFKNAVGTKYKIIRNEAGKEYELNNLNILLGRNGVEGIKTGFTEEAGQVLVTAKVEEVNGKKKTFIIVVMHSEDRFADTEVLLNYLSDNVNFLSIHP
ncbi:MAG: D-alanyl-D-alanine carboxypeptidase [Candidatus Levybacteria bacterium]|nr:D-alanyl-D-alanine carboxypeptidase [Candidatus Levybacteria bacterium]